MGGPINKSMDLAGPSVAQIPNYREIRMEMYPLPVSAVCQHWKSGWDMSIFNSSQEECL